MTDAIGTMSGRAPRVLALPVPAGKGASLVESAS